MGMSGQGQMCLAFGREPRCHGWASMALLGIGVHKAHLPLTGVFTKACDPQIITDNNGYRTENPGIILPLRSS